MDHVNQYKAAVKACLLDWYAYVSRATPKYGTEPQCLLDDERGTYMLVFVGWHEGKRKLSVHIFVRVKDGKIWIEVDWTEEGVVTELLAAGVPKSDIVLGFLSPEERRRGEFAAA
jgi:hypothetical protein